MSLAALPAVDRRARRLAILAMIGSAAAWGSATVMTKDLLERVPPFTLLSVQLSASVAALFAALVLTGRGTRLERSTRRAGLVGLLEPGLSYGLAVPGVAFTTAAAASLIGAAEPALVALVAWALFGVRPGLRLSGIIALAMAGVAFVGVSTEPETAGDHRLAGDLLVFAGTLAAAFYVVISARHAVAIEPLRLAAAQQAVGLVFVLAVTGLAVATGLAPLGTLDGSTLAAAAASGLVQYALAFWLYLAAVRVLPVGSAAVYLTLIPVFGVGGGVLLLGERLEPVQWAGAALVVAAVLLVARERT